MKDKYLLCGFKFLLPSMKKYLNMYEIDYLFPTPRFYDFITNYFLLRKNKERMKEYDVIHVNNWENFVNMEKRDGQVLIAETHGKHPGFDTHGTIISLSSNTKKNITLLLDRMKGHDIVDGIRKADIYYVSTPDLLPQAKKIRKDAQWLPNPVDVEFFETDCEKIRLAGDPVIFLPSRIHGLKNPLFALGLFKSIKKIYPGAVLHLIKYPRASSKLLKEFKEGCVEKDSYVWHDYMTIERLKQIYKSSDLVLGQFNNDIACLSLVELNVMASKVPIVTYDPHEIIKVDIPDILNYAFSMLSSDKFRNENIIKNYLYVKDVHCERKVMKLHQENLNRYF